MYKKKSDSTMNFRGLIRKSQTMGHGAGSIQDVENGLAGQESGQPLSRRLLKLERKPFI